MDRVPVMKAGVVAGTRRRQKLKKTTYSSLLEPQEHQQHAFNKMVEYWRGIWREPQDVVHQPGCIGQAGRQLCPRGCFSSVLDLFRYHP
ncbi:hypothetical protein GDO81_025123 [Engystomops pustulosus]|uniref:Uncharacterized protein n=1 Tax=Engystomops pustulosus TaxID=76066 RepID=A0AAV6YTH7_ENGPU|nr:hypothetical protein GDO81_025123 [Engystomops pustulosus]